MVVNLDTIVKDRAISAEEIAAQDDTHQAFFKEVEKDRGYLLRVLFWSRKVRPVCPRIVQRAQVG